LLVASQSLLAQGSLLEESLRAQRKPLLGVMGMVVTIVVFALAGTMLAPRGGVTGVAIAAIIAQFSFCLFMSAMLKRFHPGARLLPRGEDVRFIITNAMNLREAMLRRFWTSSSQI
jgi:Na+-driven multidrug efflux pump